MGAETLDTDSGWMPGIRVGAAVALDLPVVGNISGGVSDAYVNGPGKHFGETQNINGPTGGTLNYADHAEINEFSAEISKDFQLTPKLSVSIAGEMTYRDWNRFNAKEALSAEEDYTSGAAGGGGSFTYKLAPTLTLHGSVAVEQMFDAHLRGAGNTLTSTPTAHYVLGQEPLFASDLGLSFALSPRVALRLAASYSYFTFGESPTVVVDQGGKRASTHEPDSQTNEAAVRLGFVWRWSKGSFPTTN